MSFEFVVVASAVVAAVIGFTVEWLLRALHCLFAHTLTESEGLLLQLWGLVGSRAPLEKALTRIHKTNAPRPSPLLSLQK